MSLLKQKTDFVKRGAFDELYTPPEAVGMLLPFIPKDCKVAWEATAIKGSNISAVLETNGFVMVNTHINDGVNFLSDAPAFTYDILIDNPPYSKKNQFLKRGFELGKPFMFLLPITTLEGALRHKMFREYEMQLLMPDKRFNFKPEKGSSAWFYTCWYTWQCNLPKQLNFVKVK